MRTVLLCPFVLHLGYPVAKVGMLCNVSIPYPDTNPLAKQPTPTQLYRSIQHASTPKDATRAVGRLQGGCSQIHRQHPRQLSHSLHLGKR